uniref:Uncharacterized protein n=1 Tax=Anguilla anguilla TaxID=7936 RepID=A0A0E9V1Z3_ANGAN
MFVFRLELVYIFNI